MPHNDDPLNQKELYLHENELFTELELNKESKPIGGLRDIDLSENEVWLLQCPKGMNIAEFENQKLRIPGRTTIMDSEAVSMEFNNGKEQHAFVYYNRKGHYSLRLLPVCGTIVIRDHLKAAETVTSELAAECCSPVKRVPMPSAIRVRHPLLGAHYNDNLYLNESIKKRLQEADEVTTKILKENLNKKLFKTKTFISNASDTKRNKSLSTEIRTCEEDEIVCVSEEKLKHKKSKRKFSESEKDMSDGESRIKKQKSKKTSQVSEIVSKDLQWLQNI